VQEELVFEVLRRQQIVVVSPAAVCHHRCRAPFKSSMHLVYSLPADRGRSAAGRSR